MLSKVSSYIERHNMIRKGEGIVVGLSGGPDSVCLLHMLFSLKEKYNIKLYAVHLNHMIRGEEANRDEDYAREFAASLGIPFFSERIAVEEYAREHRLSSEEAGRFLRYELFSRIAREQGASKIALAHNMNDQAETMIMRFLRGTGISGLKGINPIRDDRYIRPILSCTREEIEDYCEINSLNPMHDSTNKESIYTRNKVRLEIIPYIRKNFNPNIIFNLFNNSEIIRDEDEYINELSREKLKEIRLSEGIEISKFNSLHRAMKRRIVRLYIEESKGDLKQIESKHVEECIDFLERSGTGKVLQLPQGIEGRIVYGIFKLSGDERFEDFQINIEVPGTTELRKLNIRVNTRIIKDMSGEFKEGRFVKYFDYDKIEGSLTLRNRRDGDYIYPKGMVGKKKLKDIFIDKKVPKDERTKMPVIALGSEIIWAVGMRDTKNYKMDGNTKRILEINFERGANNEA